MGWNDGMSESRNEIREGRKDGIERIDGSASDEVMKTFPWLDVHFVKPLVCYHVEHVSICMRG